jgi:hypothetical protein
VSIKRVKFAVIQEPIFGRCLSIIELLRISFEKWPLCGCHIREIHRMAYYSHLMLWQLWTVFVLILRTYSLQVIREVRLEVFASLVSVKCALYAVRICLQYLFQENLFLIMFASCQPFKQLGFSRLLKLMHIPIIRLPLY